MLINGESEICGEIVAISVDNLSVTVKKIDGQSIFCTASKELCLEMAENLHAKRVVFSGLARWDRKTRDLVSFRIDGFRQIKEFSQAFTELREAVGNAFDKIDVSAFVSDIRSGE